MATQAPFKLNQQVYRVSKGRGSTAWRTGQGWLTTWTPDLVQRAPDPVLAWAEYCQQVLGVPWPSTQDQAIVRKRAEQFFGRYPRADWHTLCRVVQWCKTRKRRDTRVWMVFDRFREAWVAGALPELDPSTVDPSLEARISRALEGERDPTWRRRLLGAVGTQARRAAIEAWDERTRRGVP